MTPVTRIIRDMSADQPVERAATLEDMRAEVLTPDRLNTLVFGGFAAVALAIAVVGVAGVLAFSVSGRTREFGIRLAIGSPAAASADGRDRRGRGDGGRWASLQARRAGSRWRGWPAAISQDVRMPGAVAGGRLGGRAAGRRGDRVGVAGGARRARGRHAGAAIGLIFLFTPLLD